MSVIETPRRFSESFFWRMQEEYYKNNGRAAWSSGEVPFRVEDKKKLYEVQVGIDSDEPEQGFVGTHEQLKK